MGLSPTAQENAPSSSRQFLAPFSPLCGRLSNSNFYATTLQVEILRFSHQLFLGFHFVKLYIASRYAFVVLSLTS